MKIWVTGARGMLGSAMCRLLENKKIAYIGSDRSVDIAYIEQVLQFLTDNQGITHIVNCAAYTHVDNAEQEVIAAYSANIHGPHNLSIAALEYNLHLTHFSTDYVFNGQSNTPYEEHATCDPIGVYGSTKYSGENKIKEIFPQSCIIRTSWLFGLDGKNFVSTMLQLMLQQETLRVVSDQLGRPTFCNDLAEVTLALLLGKQSGVFHFANRGAISWHDFALGIAEEARRCEYFLKVQAIDAIRTSEYPTKASRPAYSVLNTSKIEAVLKFKPRSWQEALSDYFQQLQT